MSLLPKNDRRVVEEVKQKKIWLYGGVASGKTTFADGFPKPLMLNTDGNIKFVTSPYLIIKDQVQVTGRIKNVQLAWEYFKDIVDELEECKNDFETVVVDLIEDLYQMCRLYIYQRENITHESDNSFKAWDMVTNEYLNTMSKLLNLDYENMVLISHEDTTRDITNQKGDNITQIKPNLRDKVALKVAGMVDLTGRIVIEDGDKRFLSFKTDNVIFGGKRIPINKDRVPLEYKELDKLYKLEVEVEENKNIKGRD